MKSTHYYKTKNLIIIYFIITALLTLSFSSKAQKFVFEDPEFSFQALRTVGYSSTGAADISECLNTCYQIEETNYDSWYNEWNKTAQRLEQTAEEFLKNGHKKSAKEAFFRASNYYRTAGFFLIQNPKDPQLIENWENSRNAFLKAIPFAENPIQYLRIPFEETTLPAYLCLVDDSDKTRPLLIVHSGFDGTAEEIYFEIGKMAVERGFNVLLFEGPGQGEMIRKHNIKFRPDWETVVSPVIDYALELPQTDPENIALVGISFGGYLAPRAAAYDDRIKVCVANGGIYDFYDNMIKKNPPGIEKIIFDAEASKQYDQSILSKLGKNPTFDFFYWNGMYTFGAQTPSELMRMLKPYHLRNVADKIKCKMIVVDSEEDKSLPGQAHQLFEALNFPKEYLLFTKEEGAAEHCQMGAVMISSERILNLLEELMGESF